MKQGDVVLTPITQADGKVKQRPVIILREMPPFQDCLVCGVSTQLHQQVKGFDEIIAPSDPDFKTSVLVASSLIPHSLLSLDHFLQRKSPECSRLHHKQAGLVFHRRLSLI